LSDSGELSSIVESDEAVHGSLTSGDTLILEEVEDTASTTGIVKKTEVAHSPLKVAVVTSSATRADTEDECEFYASESHLDFNILVLVVSSERRAEDLVAISLDSERLTVPVDEIESESNDYRLLTGKIGKGSANGSSEVESSEDVGVVEGSGTSIAISNSPLAEVETRADKLEVDLVKARFSIVAS